MAASEVLIPFPETIVSLSQVRATILLSSQDALRKMGLYDTYLARVPAHADALRTVLAGTWVPLDVATAHYEACDRLALPAAKIVELGHAVSTSAHNVLASSALRMAKEAGATPWTLFAHSDRFWARAWNGSAVSIARVGPKDAHVRFAGLPLARIPYFRTAFVGFLTAVAEFVATRAFARQVAAECTPTSLGYRLAWA